MTWTNAFELGACTVQVGNDTEPDAYFSGVLAKGETSAQFDGKLSNEKLTASVTADGEVQLNWISGNGPALGYSLYVIPSYSLGIASMRTSGFVIPEGVSGNAQTYSSSDGSVSVILTSVGDVWSPDPADISEPAFQAFWAVFAGQIV